MITPNSNSREVWGYLQAQGYKLDEVSVSKRPVFGYIRVTIRGVHHTPAAGAIRSLFPEATVIAKTPVPSTSLVLIPATLA